MTEIEQLEYQRRVIREEMIEELKEKENRNDSHFARFNRQASQMASNNA